MQMLQNLFKARRSELYRKPIFCRPAYTLLELILALSLTMLVSGLIGMLLQLYYRSSDLSQADVRQAQVARNLLRMIADDIRSVVRYQEFDSATLAAVMGTGGAVGAAGDAAAAGTGEATGTDSGAVDSSSADSSSSVAAGDLASSSEPPPEPGIYGNQYQLLVDVSRLPRPDQYFALQGNVMDVQLNDVPSDVKSVCYYVQASGLTSGVQDPLASGSLTGIATEQQNTATNTGGLVRRQLDRAVTQWANSQGQSERLMRTGELLASEVISVEFMYFDGTQWVTQWDSSQQSLPYVIRILLAMQDPRVAQKNPLASGSPVSMMAADQIQSYGVRVYELSVAIPGAQLLQSSEQTDSGMESLGIQQ
ncbi:MAG: hypothetical protein RLY14_659 [Planctomycetota bacterium]|jgi:type II secretory pathway pseudopilin PulG